MESFCKPAKPLIVDENIHNNWNIFLQAFEIFMKASEKDKATKEVQAAIFLIFLGEDAIELFNTCGLSENSQKDVDKIKKAFGEYINPRKNVIYERFLFYNRNQKEGEDFENYVNEIKKMIQTCEFGSREDEMLRDRIVLGIKHNDVQESLLRTSQLTLPMAILICTRSAEVSKNQVRYLRNEVDSLKTITNSRQEQPSGSGSYFCKKCHRKHGP